MKKGEGAGGGARPNPREKSIGLEASPNKSGSNSPLEPSLNVQQMLEDTLGK